MAAWRRLPREPCNKHRDFRDFSSVQLSTTICPREMASESMRIYSDYTIIFSFFAGYEWFFFKYPHDRWKTINFWAVTHPSPKGNGIGTSSWRKSSQKNGRDQKRSLSSAHHMRNQHCYYLDRPWDLRFLVSTWCLFNNKSLFCIIHLRSFFN